MKTLRTTTKLIFTLGDEAGAQKSDFLPYVFMNDTISMEGSTEIFYNFDADVEVPSSKK